MTVLKSVELTDTLRAIMSRNTEYGQTDYAKDMQELLYGTQRNYLFLSHQSGTFLAPEEAVYYRESTFHEAWVGCDEQRLEQVKAFAVSVDRRMPGHVRGDICPLNFRDHIVDIRLNETSVFDRNGQVGEHVRLLREARQNRMPNRASAYLRELESQFMTRGGPYRAGFRRIGQADAYALIREELLPVYRLNAENFSCPLRKSAWNTTTYCDSFGIRVADSNDYDHWQREALLAYCEKLKEANKNKGSEAR